MADVQADKKQKLANTRKRFKELQELKKRRNDSKETPNQPDSAHLSNRNTPIEPTIADSTQDELLSHSHVPAPQFSENISPNVPQKIQHQQDAVASLYKPPDSNNSSAFFDNISQANVESVQVENHSSPSLLTYFNTTPEASRDEIESDNIGLPKYFDNVDNSSLIWENTVLERSKDDYKLFPSRNEKNKGDCKVISPIQSDVQDEDVVCQDYPEIKQNEIGEYVNRKNAESLGLGALTLASCDDNNVNNLYSPGVNKNLMEYLDTREVTEEEQEESDISSINRQIDCSTDLTKKEIQHLSNVESLRQFSDQLAQLIGPNYVYTSSSGSITDLEKRNIGLAANLNREKINSEQLRSVNLELQERITQLESQLSNQEVESDFQNIQEVSHLKNELQAHLQTIGLLVAEKTELSSNLSQYELSCKQKTTECEELQARLKTSRGRVADLEREVGNLKTEKSKLERVGEQYGTALDSLREEYKVLKDQKDELAQDLLEVRQKLRNTMEEKVKLQENNKDLSRRLALAEVKIEQLSSGGSIGVDSQIEQLAQEKFSLESELVNLNQMLKSIVKERDESTVQFQQYAQQLNAQITNLSSKLEKHQLEKENLLTQEQNRIKHISELERQLQNLQNDQVTFATRNSNNTDLREDLEKSREMCVQLQIKKTTIEESYTKVSNEKELLLKELEAKTDSISQLESLVEQLRGNQPDSVKLLATMESDKVAASRAIQQNKELKQQLESMQEVFLKMDNDKVELTENLQAQHQTNKELLEKLQKTELTLQHLADAIEIKDKELMHLREASDEISRQAIHHEQLEDRLRHYEAHNNMGHILQNELQEAKQTIMRLTNEINKRTTHENGADELQDAKQTILELTNEINKLKLSSSSEVGKDGLIEAQENNVPNSAIEVPVESTTDRDENVLDKENAMRHLEEKVKRTMQEIADLTDEKQRLEHIVLQLQGETETIGEYVALYQHQRMILKQKALENEQQLKQLANEREQIKIKLDRLNELIRKLVIEKGTVPAELLQHKESMNHDINNFCEEHSKINEEINKMKQSNVIEPEIDVRSKEKNETAEEIITLLSEIKASNLVQPDENFHHCPWCSGRQLMTV